MALKYLLTTHSFVVSWLSSLMLFSIVIYYQLYIIIFLSLGLCFFLLLEFLCKNIQSFKKKAVNLKKKNKQQLFKNILL